MRCVAGASLLALVGCNQVFGIAPTRPYDASIDGVIDVPHVVLDWQVAVLLASGAPDPTMMFVPIDPAPKVRIALLDRPFDVDQATYSSDDGWIRIPRDYLNTTWRLEYTLAGEVPHEVQWAPEDKQGHLAVPVFGHLQRDPVPTGGGYTITPSGVASFSLPRVFTTGLWTEAKVNNYVPSDGATIDFDFFNATSLSGTKGRPDPALGDRALLVDYVIDGGSGCRVAAGSAALASAAIQPGVHSVQTPTWDAGRKTVAGAPVDFKFVTRLGMSLGKLESMFNGPSSTLMFGAAASTDMPGFAATPAESSLLGALLPVPVMQPLLQCSYSVNLLPKVAQPMMLDAFPHVLHVQLIDTRQALGVTFNSGMETVLTSAAAGGFTMAFPAAIPMHFLLATPANGSVDLAGDSDQVGVGPASGPLDLTFTREADADLRADYYDVVLHRIASGVLTTERIYTVTAPKVRIDGSLLVPGADYVFEVRSYKGHPQAQRGNFVPVDYPYGAAIVFTRTFKAS
ncbi:MAG TPA: hypothetical protein VHN14_02065 [Kofleriaceae bacterium]|jgi:hypothetical protein|nr:hypothetical protein [Kofleriaceae bacterium]